jgi:nucleoredoxin
MSSGLVALLGDKLLSGSEEIGTSEALANKGAVALYFSAHWCPPCRGFTPQLAKWYSDGLNGKGLEIVFVSSDRDEAAFKEYFEDMPWKALPYNDRERKEALSKKFKVDGIPSVIILDADGCVINKDGRAAISSDPQGEEFPWRPKSLKDILGGAKLKSKEGPVDASVLEGKVFALYFSAHWCPPCRGFTPKLAEWYSTSLKDKGLEVVFVSSDKDKSSFDSYFGEQPWLALDYSNRKEKEQLSNLFGVRGIPSLVIIDKDGSTITKDGRAAVSSDPEGAEFPWYPKPVQDLAGGPGLLNSAAVVVALCEAADAAAQQSAEEAMAPLARRYLDKAKAAGEEDPEVSFMIAKAAGGITAQLRKMMSLPEVGTGSALPCKLMLINIPDDGAFFEGPEGPVTTAAAERLVADFEAGSLERKQLEK